MSATSQPAPTVLIPPTTQEELLIRADRAQVIASLSRGMAHDLRGPLQALTLLADPNADLPAGPGGARLRQAVSESVQHLTDTVGRFSQIYAPREAEPAPVVVDDLLATLVDLQRYQRSLPAVQIRLELPGGLPPVKAVESDLRHLLLSLICNAKQALGARADASITLGAAKESGMVRLEVTDNGPGLGAAEREAAFQPFHPTHPGQLGIGLCVARMLAVRNGGTLELNAGPGGGIQALLRLPVWPRMA